MRTHLARASTKTLASLDFVDVTDEVAAALEESRIKNGHVTAFASGRDCSLILNERESGLWHDLKTALASDDELPADRRAVLGSSSVVVPALEGRLHLGRWQRVLLVELGEPSERTVSVQIVGE
ncbi:MAG TPA: YjbQ family protein [Actinomycetota bacterium]|nr:YjbQ family protein [Actinomycetota bacterium]